MTIELQAENNLLMQMNSFDSYSFDRDLIKDFRSDHSGEVGAVYIYNGILCGTKDKVIKDFAIEHISTEKKHLSFFENWLPVNMQSALVPAWKIAGFMLGYIPAKLGRYWVYITISAVECFVVEHYTTQLHKLKNQHQNSSELIKILTVFSEDELSHLNDSEIHQHTKSNFAQRIWQTIIVIGSRYAVKASRII